MRPELANKFSVSAWGESMPSWKEMSVSTLPEKVIPVMIRSARTCCTASSCARRQYCGSSQKEFHRFVSIHAGPRTMDLRTFPKHPLFQIVTLTLRSWFGPGSTRCLQSALLPSPMGGYP
jgi:hypothetical protein